MGKTLVDAAAVFNAPLLVTEQYPKVFKNTVASLGVAEKLAAEGSKIDVFEKTIFSMVCEQTLAKIEWNIE